MIVAVVTEKFENFYNIYVCKYEYTYSGLETKTILNYNQWVGFNFDLFSNECNKSNSKHEKLTYELANLHAFLINAN